MQIKCENCGKQFNLDEELIPSKGRYLQCGSCNHKWFYKKKETINEVEYLDKQDINDENTQLKKNIENDTNVNFQNKKIEKKIISKKVENKQTIKKINAFNFLLVCIITIIAIILLLDTFKNNIRILYPSIDYLLNNLYESLKDIRLFIKDLIK